MAKNNYILLIVFMLCMQIVTAQDLVHYSMWSRLRFSKTFNPKWEAELDLQYRRQDNNDLNIFSLPLAQSARLWIYHRPVPRWTIGFSPFTWFHNYQLITKPGDKPREWDEYRIYLYGEYKTSFARKLILLNRLGTEPTLQIRGWGNRNFIRLRWREQLNLQLRHATQAFIGSELFVNSMGSEKMNFYSQSRFFAGILYHLSANFEITTSYIFQHIDIQSSNSNLESHDLLIGAHVHF